jgi:hypothetical protein
LHHPLTPSLVHSHLQGRMVYLARLGPYFRINHGRSSRLMRWCLRHNQATSSLFVILRLTQPGRKFMMTALRPPCSMEPRTARLLCTGFSTHYFSLLQTPRPFQLQTPHPFQLYSPCPFRLRPQLTRQLRLRIAPVFLVRFSIFKCRNRRELLFLLLCSIRGQQPSSMNAH